MLQDEEPPLATSDDLLEVIDELLALNLIEEKYDPMAGASRFCLKPSGVAQLFIPTESEVAV